MDATTPRPKHGCTGKVAIPDAVSAMRSAKRINGRSGDAVHHYRCRFCRHWHVGGTVDEAIEHRNRNHKRRVRELGQPTCD